MTKRTVSPSQCLLAYSARYVPPATPMGVPSRMASRLITTLPNRALARPPGSLGGGVIWVNRSRLRLPMPLVIVVHRIQTSHIRPNRAATMDSDRATPFLTLRQV